MEDVEMIRIGAAARMLGRSERTVREWAKQSKLIEFRDASHVRYYRRDQVEALMPRPVLASTVRA